MKKVVFFIFILIALAGTYGFYLYNKPSVDVQTSTTDLYFKADDLIKDNKAILTYIDKVIEVDGVISAIEESDESSIVILNNGIKCELLAKATIKTGQAVKIKGIYTGFDEMFNEISLKKCHIVIEK